MSKEIEEYYPREVYECRFCGATHLFEEHAKVHASTCIRNPLKFKGASTDKGTKILMVDPKQEGYNGYTNVQLIEWLGYYNRLVVTTDEGYRVLTEDEILEENPYHEPLDLDEQLEIIHSDLWAEELELITKGVEEQREIGESIEEFWADIKLEVEDLESKGLNEKEIAKAIREKYNLKE